MAYFTQLEGFKKTSIAADVKHMLQRVEKACSEVYVCASLECLLG